MAPPALEFLVVDDQLDNRFLLTSTLRRNFPNATLHECDESTEAVNVVNQGALAAAIVHRAADVAGISLVEMLRAANRSLPILYVSGYNRREQASHAGATAFLSYDAWLTVGAAVEGMLTDHSSEPSPT